MSVSGRILIWIGLALWAAVAMLSPLSTLTTTLVVAAGIGIVVIICFGVLWQIAAAEAVVRFVGWPLGRPNRRALCLLCLMLTSLIAAWWAPWGESVLAGDIRDTYQLYNKLAEYHGWQTQVNIPAPAPTITKGWWIGWAGIYLLAFGVYVPVALKESLARAAELFWRRKSELDERYRSAAARHPGAAAAGGATAAAGTGHRWGAIMGTLFLAIEFLGDVFLHGGFGRK